MKTIIRNLTGLLLLGTVACTQELPSGAEFSKSPVTLQALLTQAQGETTGGTNGEPITQGTFALSYVAPDGTQKTVECRFEDGTGRAYPIGCEHPLRWDEIQNGAPPHFFLDNLLPRKTNKNWDETYSVTITFSDLEGSEKYNAQIENEPGKSPNDIVSGYLLPEYASEEITFSLEHRMSRLSVEMSDNTKDQLFAGNPQVTITLTGIVLTPYQFIRQIKPYGDTYVGDSKVTIGENPTYKDFNLLENAPLTPITGENEGETTHAKYTSPNLIFPPQTLREGNERPKLSITVTPQDGVPRTFSGKLPEAMITDNGEYMHLMYFAPGNHLVLRVRFDQEEEDMTIKFLPALVKDWDNKGNFYINGKHSGIYSQEEFDTCIKAFNNVTDEAGLFALASTYGGLDYDEDGNPTILVLYLSCDIPTIPTTKFNNTTEGFNDKFRIVFNNWKIGSGEKALTKWDDTAKAALIGNGEATE